MVLGRKIGNGQQMTSINVKISRSNVKDTVAFYAITMSAQYLEKFLSDSHGTWQEDQSYSVDDPYTFQVKGQGSIFMQKLCPLNILKSLKVTVIVLGGKTGHGQQMNI